jgi:D-arabinose 1-dehydrogenase-like Zn-dependent alcohol dehydrogenase
VWEDFTYAGPGAGEVLVELEACGVGLTVLNWAAGDLIRDDLLLPVVPGHEVIGHVTEVGDPAFDHLLGHRVTAYSYLFCGRCAFCLAGQENRCLDLAGWVGLHRDGGYAPFTVLPGRNAIPIGDGGDPVAATVIPDALSTSVHVCMTRAQLTPDDRVMVIGAAGGIGIHLVQVAALTGAKVVGIDIGAEKLAALEQVGCRAVDGSNLGARGAAAFWDSRRPTVVIDLVGNEETLGWALGDLEMGGRLIVLTTFRDQRLSVEPRLLVSKEISIVASRAASRAEYAQAADLFSQGAVESVIGAARSPRDVQEIHTALRNSTLVGRGAIDWRSHD